MKAMVLCAGYGTRLGALTHNLPKPMLHLHGHPLLAYILSHLRAHGFRQIAVNLHFQPEAIRDYLGNGSPWQIQLTYSYEEKLLGTAGGIKKLAAFFQKEDAFLIQYGDVITDQDFTEMLRFHRERRALATLLVHERSHSNSVVSLDASGRIVEFLERPPKEARQSVHSPWVNSGICVCSPEILDLIPTTVPCDLPREVFTPLVDSNRLYGFALTGYRCAIDSPARLAEARQRLAEGHCQIQPLARPGGHPPGAFAALAD